MDFDGNINNEIERINDEIDGYENENELMNLKLLLKYHSRISILLLIKNDLNK